MVADVEVTISSDLRPDAHPRQPLDVAGARHGRVVRREPDRDPALVEPPRQLAPLRGRAHAPIDDAVEVEDHEANVRWKGRHAADIGARGDRGRGSTARPITLEPGESRQYDAADSAPRAPRAASAPEAPRVMRQSAPYRGVEETHAEAFQPMDGRLRRPDAHSRGVWRLGSSAEQRREPARRERGESRPPAARPRPGWRRAATRRRARTSRSAS